MTAARSYYTPDPAVIVASANAAVRQQLLHRFNSSQIRAAEAFGGADAIGKLEASECRLLLLDGKLPDLAAEEVLQTIHARFPGIDVLLLDDAGRPLIPGEWRSADSRQIVDAASLLQASEPKEPKE